MILLIPAALSVHSERTGRQCQVLVTMQERLQVHIDLVGRQGAALHLVMEYSYFVT